MKRRARRPAFFIVQPDKPLPRRVADAVFAGGFGDTCQARRWLCFIVYCSVQYVCERSVKYVKEPKVNMQRITPITDLQRQAGPLVNSLAGSDEAILITQRGRAAAVLLSAARYAEIEKDLARLDELELREMLAAGRQAKAEGRTLTNEEVKRQLGFVEDAGGAL
jgi:prevent-host-death family protein